MVGCVFLGVGLLIIVLLYLWLPFFAFLDFVYCYCMFSCFVWDSLVFDYFALVGFDDLDVCLKFMLR